MNPKYRLGILLFDDVEVLDFAGPFEVFAISGNQIKPGAIEVVTVAEKSPVIARNGLSVNPTHLITEAPALDILLVPGGPGTRQEIHNGKLLKWLTVQSKQVELLLSVCTGALLLAQAGLVSGMSLITHHLALDELRAIAPGQEILTGQRFVDNGKVILSAGISAGIDMAFYVVEKLLGPEVAVQTVAYMEYERPK